MKQAFFTLVTSILAATLVQSKSILISFDAFGWNYLDKFKVETPNINRLIKTGVYANYGIRNEYPTVTLPNHVTLVTGRHVDEHGMVANNMYDPVLNETFKSWSVANGYDVSEDEVDYEKSTRWFENSAEPIWATIKRQSGKKSISMMWPLSNFDYRGYRVDAWLGWNVTVPYEERIDQLVAKLDNDEYAFGTLYIEELDMVIHEHGLEGQEARDAMVRVDKVVGYLLEKLEMVKLWPCCTDIIITGDHGMSQVNVDNVIHLPLISDTSKYDIYYQTIISNKGYEEAVFLNLSRATHMRTYHKYEPTPRAQHFSRHRRIHDIVYFLDDGYYLSREKPEELDRTKTFWGTHGYDSRFSSMWPVFIANGPSFKENVNVNPFNNTQIYCLLCYMHKIDPHADTHCRTKETDLLFLQTMRNLSFKFTRNFAISAYSLKNMFVTSFVLVIMQNIMC